MITMTRAQLREFLGNAIKHRGTDAVLDAVIDQMGVPALNKLCKTVSVTVGIELYDGVVMALVQTCQISFIEAADIASTVRAANPNSERGSGDIMGKAFAEWHTRRQEGKYNA